jgi:hypothetical protein
VPRWPCTVCTNKDYEEWVHQATQRQKECINVLDDAWNACQASWKAQRGYTYQDVIDGMLEDLCRLNPEWQVQKEEAQQASLRYVHDFDGLCDGTYTNSFEATGGMRESSGI